MARRANGDAPSMQNLAPSGFSTPHFEQRIVGRMCRVHSRDPRARLFEALFNQIAANFNIEG
jgi:hypothetical protein